MLCHVLPSSLSGQSDCLEHIWLHQTLIQSFSEVALSFNGCPQATQGPQEVSMAQEQRRSTIQVPKGSADDLPSPPILGQEAAHEEDRRLAFACAGRVNVILQKKHALNNLPSSKNSNSPDEASSTLEIWWDLNQATSNL